MPTMYTLEAGTHQLASHEGRRVEIKGRLMPPRPARAAGTSPSIATGIQRIAVDAIEEIAEDCPVPKR
jgi:hypothetical protein